MLEKIANHVVKRAIREREELNSEVPVITGNSGEKQRGRKKSSYRTHSINLDYVESTLKNVFDYRLSDLLSSRVKFKVQDLID